MLKYKCLLCEIEWGDPRATESDISHGYCPTCIQERYTVESIGHNEKQATLIASTEAATTAPKSAAASDRHVKMI